MRGFTLIEMMYTLTVAALLLAVGIPSFQSSIRSSHMTAAVNDMVASLQFARSEAVKRRAPVTVCRADQAQRDADSCGGGGSWESGWLVFADADGNGAVDNGDPILRRQEGMRGSVAVSVAGGQDPMPNSITYLATGFPNWPGALNNPRNLLLCDERKSDAFGRILTISQTGRPLTLHIGDLPGVNLTCE